MPSMSIIRHAVALFLLATLAQSETPFTALTNDVTSTPSSSPATASTPYTTSTKHENEPLTLPFLQASVLNPSSPLDTLLTNSTASLTNTDENDLTDPTLHTDLKRQSCASGYLPCHAAGYCCASNTICTTDMMGQVACCPQGAACTGAVVHSSASSTATGTNAARISSSSSSGVLGFSSMASTTTQAQNPTGTDAIVAAGSTVAFIQGAGGAGRIGDGKEGWVWGVVIGLVGLVGVVV